MTKQKVLLTQLHNNTKSIMTQLAGSPQIENDTIKQAITYSNTYTAVLESYLSQIQPSLLTQARITVTNTLAPALNLGQVHMAGEDSYIEVEVPEQITEEAGNGEADTGGLGEGAAQENMPELSSDSLE
jgi:hypothetical protein